MSTFFEDTMQSIIEAIAIENGNISVAEIEGLPAKTLRACPQNVMNISQNKGMHKKASSFEACCFTK